jgi:hypothetical protein
MQAIETKQVLDFIAAADGRNITEQTYGAWHIVLGHLSFEQARTAAVLALQDQDIRWVEPKHVLAKVSKLISDSEADQRRNRALTYEDNKRGMPMPNCKHDLGLLYCNECCHQAAIDAGLIENKPFQKKR